MFIWDIKKFQGKGRIYRSSVYYFNNTKAKNMVHVRWYVIVTNSFFWHSYNEMFTSEAYPEGIMTS